MAYRYDFTQACAKDLVKLSRNRDLLVGIVTQHIPTILENPHEAGEKKKGDLADVRARDIKIKGGAYRLIYKIEGDVILFVALGPHDAAYARAGRR